MSGTVHPLFPEGARAPDPQRPVAPDDAALIERVVRGDAAAHRALFDRYHARVASFVRRRVQDPALCEEIVSDVFFEIWRGAAAYRGESSVPSWIFGIAHFKALGARRFQSQRKRAWVVPTSDEEMARMADHRAEADYESRDEVRRLMSALTVLPRGQQQVLTLAFLEGRSYQEISTELGITEGNVKTRINRARTRLRALLNRERGDA